MAEREILMTGIGGQGVQLAAKMLATAGMLEGRHVMQFSMFMGSMRGGSSECTVVVADGPVEAPPVVPHAWAAIAMHPSELGLVEKKLRPGSAIVYNRTLFPEPPALRGDCRWVPVDAGRIASERQYLQGQSLVALGAFCALTGIVAAGSLEEALKQMLPSYRHHTIPKNVDCLAAGAAAMAEHAGAVPAWNGVGGS
ncbi:MAG TPA: 2-oxoacid:acceptor oxidoreductase family protein [Candidatus Binatia bacterium]|nr:2-oxoacid:acceptor oxidoreductase family protein [Candidatus Binatia bacterium]